MGLAPRRLNRGRTVWQGLRVGPARRSTPKWRGAGRGLWSKISAAGQRGAGTESVRPSDARGSKGPGARRGAASGEREQLPGPSEAPGPRVGPRASGEWLKGCQLHVRGGVVVLRGCRRGRGGEYGAGLWPSRAARGGWSGALRGLRGGWRRRVGRGLASRPRGSPSPSPRSPRPARPAPPRSCARPAPPRNSPAAPGEEIRRAGRVQRHHALPGAAPRSCPPPPHPPGAAPRSCPTPRARA